jgi:hypothetical protein
MSRPTACTAWYREPWPWIAMAGPAVAVIGSLVSAWLAVHGADPVVDENYYEHGLQINRKLGTAQAAPAQPALKPRGAGPGLP